ncbi:MAG: hypothetical protein HXX09_06670 [Bacteroidetes bacterium]|nr:hypothetical protein [Bacteroidota bacterium]
MNKNFITAFSVSLLLIANIGIFAQDSTKTKAKIDLGADLVSRYLWRGQLYDATPNVQPFINLERGGLKFGAWGSYGMLSNFGEVDLSLSYTYKWFTIQANDYFFIPDEKAEKYKYFNFDSKSTKHSIEGALIFEGGEKFPLKLTLASFLYGDDRDSLGNNYYSTYFEAAYPFNIENIEMNVFVGITDKENIYGNGIGLINTGISACKKIKINKDFDIPITCSLVSNPQAESIFFILMVSF